MLSFECRGEKFSLVFLEGKEFLGGGTSKLRSIRTAPETRPLKASKEFIRFREEKEKNEGDILLNLASFAKVLNRGKGEVGEVVWIESETKEVLSNLGSLKKCLVGRWDASSSCLLVLES